MLVFLLIFVVRFLVLTRLTNSPYFIPDGDAKFYTDWAFRIMHGQWTDHQAFYGLPGYAFLLAGIFSVGGFNPFLVGFIQAGVDGAIGVVMLQIAVLLLPGRRGLVAGGLVAVGWALFQPAQAFSAVLMPTIWLIFAFWGCVLWVMKENKPSLWYPWLPLGICVGLVSTTVATILFVLPLAAAVMIVRLRSLKIGVALPLMLAGVFAGASPCWYHNYFIAKEPVLLSAHSGLNFYIGNNEVANGYPRMPRGMRASQVGMLRDSITMAEKDSGRHLTHAEVSQYWSQKAHDYIQKNPAKWRSLMFTKFCNAWSARQYDDLSLITLFSEEGIIFPGLRFGIVAALGLAGFVLAVMANRKAVWVLSAVLLHLAALMPVFITERYRMAAIPGLLILGAVGICEFVLLLRARQWWKPVVYLLVLGVAITGIFWNAQCLEIKVTDSYNVGLRQCDSGSMEHAEKNLTWAFNHVPNNAEVNFAFGNFWMKKGRLDLSRNFYLRAICLDSQHVGAFNNLAVIAIENKNWPIAERLASSAQQIDPQDAKGFLLLAIIEANRGEYEKADATMEQAVRLSPGSRALKEMQKSILSRNIPPISGLLPAGI